MPSSESGAQPRRQRTRMGACAVPGCGDQAVAKGHCLFHRRRELKGLPLDAPRVRDGGKAADNCKLTVEQVREIRRRHQAGEDRWKIAADFGVGVHTVTRIGNRQAWKNVD